MAEGVMRLGLVLSATDKMSRVISQTMGRSMKSMADFQKKANAIADTTNKIGLGMIGVGTSVSTALFGMVKNTADNAKEISRASQRVGMSTEAFQVYSEAAKRAGIDTDRFQSSTARLAKNQYMAAHGNKALSATFKSMGVSVFDANGNYKKTNVLMRDLADKFQKAPDGTKKIAYATALFGKAGKDMIPMLNKGGAALDKLSEEMKLNGNIIDTEGIEKAKRFNEKMRDMTEKLEGAKNKIAIAVMPAFTKLGEKMLVIITRITTWIKENKALIPKLIHWAKITMEVGVGIWAISTAIKAVVAISQTIKTVVAVFKAVKMIIWGVRSGYYALIAAQKLGAAWTGIVAAATWAWNAAFVASPIGWIVLGIGALVGVLALAWNKFEGFRATIKTTWEVVKGFGSILKDYVIDRIKGIISGLGSMGRAIGLLFKGKFAEAGGEALKGVKALSGYDATKKAMASTMKLTQSIAPTYTKILASEKAVTSQKEKQGKSIQTTSKTEQSLVQSRVEINRNVSTKSVSEPVIHFNQTVNVSGGSATAKLDFMKMMNESKPQIEQFLKGITDNQKRMGY